MLLTAAGYFYIRRMALQLRQQRTFDLTRAADDAFFAVTSFRCEPVSLFPLSYWRLQLFKVGLWSYRVDERRQPIQWMKLEALPLRFMN